MQTTDGLACTWDFKDRLTAVENAQMRAEYTCDYTDRRITKRVFPKTNGVASTRPDVTLYVDRTFELREDGAPVKYVWNGDTRVARVTANLNATQRVQRFSLQPGANLVALAVTLTDGTAQLLTAPVQQVFRQGPGLGQYSAILPNEAIPAGTILRVQASAAGTLAVHGTWTAPAAATYPAGRQWIANSRFEPLDVAARLPADAPLWFFDAATQDWRHRFLAPLASAGNHPSRLAPGEATFAATTAPFTLSAPDPTLEIRYYHQGYLGSSSVMSDANGQLVSESTYYPFGHPRQENQPRGVKESYQFTQKERDGESGLSYFEKRFNIVSLARFCSVDPIALTPSILVGKSPQYGSSYCYSLGNPLRFSDPSGEFSKEMFVQGLREVVVGTAVAVAGGATVVASEGLAVVPGVLAINGGIVGIGVGLTRMTAAVQDHPPSKTLVGDLDRAKSIGDAVADPKEFLIDKGIQTSKGLVQKSNMSAGNKQFLNSTIDVAKTARDTYKTVKDLGGDGTKLEKAAEAIQGIDQKISNIQTIMQDAAPTNRSGNETK